MADIHNALLCTVAANIMRGEGSTPATLADFYILKPDDYQAEPLPAPLQDRGDNVTDISEAGKFRRTLRGF